MVSDNGVGMQSAGTPPVAGLGATIVEALSQQLQASTAISDGNPRTVVSNSHKEVDRYSAESLELVSAI